MYTSGLDQPEAFTYFQTQIDTIHTIMKLSSMVTLPPPPTSELHRLNLLVPSAPVPLVQSVSAGLRSAATMVQHVHHLATSGGPDTPLLVLQVLCRTALMGAGRVAFVVAPTSASERENNARIVLAQEQQSYLRCLKAAQKFADLRAMVPPQGLIEAATDVTITYEGNRGEGAVLRTMAETFEAAVNERYQSDAPSTTLGEAAQWIWNTFSGRAHGYGWPDNASGDFVSEFGVIIPIVHLAFDASVKATAPGSAT